MSEFSARIVSNQLLANSSTRVLEVERPATCDYAILPGAGAVLSSHNSSEVERAYSFANAPDAPYWRFYIRHIEGGSFCETIAKKKLGEELCIREFFYFFSLGSKQNQENQEEQESYFFATGTGIAPFLCALTAKDSPFKLNPPKAIFYGARTSGDLLELETIKACTHFKSHYHFYVSRETPLCGMTHGRISDALASPHLIASIISPRARYYIAGLDQMVSEVSNRLIALGAHYSQISSELFYGQTASESIHPSLK
ncbi:MAG: hypothetical protein HQK50_05770 [Oligoflexia bacterium]|nr:hypothetical protein [Oligoflexia bacterium]MBF0365058.1 hypothetical protein [Oligoflexia bacterium]